VALSDRIVSKPKTFTAWLETLPERHQTTIEGWRHDPNITNADIIAAIRDDDPDDNFTGFLAHKDTIARWRREHQ
jgi:hypothetical protein